MPSAAHRARLPREAAAAAAAETVAANLSFTRLEHVCEPRAVAHRSAGCDVSWQPSLLDLDVAPAIDPRFLGVQRFPLDEHAWVDLLPGWARGGDSLLDRLIATAPWEPQRTRVMWESIVQEPRILARWPDLTTLPPVVADMRAALSDRYATDFDLVAVNFYRDGRDSVAWHGDRVRLTHADPLVCTVSLGHRRRFLLRPRGGGRSIVSWALGAGDLVVMGGACQHDWEHCVPKASHAGARLSITFRHSGAAGARANCQWPGGTDAAWPALSAPSNADARY